MRRVMPRSKIAKQNTTTLDLEHVAGAYICLVPDACHGLSRYFVYLLWIRIRHEASHAQIVTSAETLARGLTLLFFSTHRPSNSRCLPHCSTGRFTGRCIICLGAKHHGKKSLNLSTAFLLCMSCRNLQLAARGHVVCRDYKRAMCVLRVCI